MSVKLNPKSYLFKLIPSDDRISDLIDAVWNEAEDPPVFYNRGLLDVFQTLTGKDILWATLTKDGVLKAALPTVQSRRPVNVTYDGWDNLNAIYSKCCAEQEKAFFGNN